MYRMLVAATLAFAPVASFAQEEASTSGLTEQVTFETGFAFRPTYLTADGSHVLGTAFVIRDSGKDYLFTSFSLFTTANGLTKQPSGRELTNFFSSVLLNDLFTGQEVARAEPALRLDDATPTEMSRAVAIFPVTPPDPADVASRMKDVQLNPKTLAAAAPKIGDSIVMVARLDSGAESEAAEHKATVVLVEQGILYYEFDSAKLNLVATPGAPLLNAAGEVVGFHNGGGAMEGKLIGAGPSATVLAARLAKARKD